MDSNTQQVKLKGSKRLFFKLGTCSQAVGFILDREFGHIRKDHEHALDPLAGGILQQGYQCGMLWGASLAIGAEAFRRENNTGKAIALTIKATGHMMESFIRRTKSTDCEDIAKCDWSSKASMAKFMISGKFLSCYNLIEKWAPEAVVAANEGLSHDPDELPENCKSCASEVIKKMGGTDEETAMVAGFAGGIGLSGNACGALAAAICMSTLTDIIRKNKKTGLSNPIWDKQLKDFLEVTDYEMECSAITGRKFETIEEHSDFIRNGGCEKLIDVLVQI